MISGDLPPRQKCHCNGSMLRNLLPPFLSFYKKCTKNNHKTLVMVWISVRVILFFLVITENEAQVKEVGISQESRNLHINYAISPVSRNQKFDQFYPISTLDHRNDFLSTQFHWPLHKTPLFQEPNSPFCSQNAKKLTHSCE